MPLRFIYFDLGNVLLFFDHQLAARQMAEVAGISPVQAWKAVFDDGLEARYERGEIDDRQFHEAFCAATGSQPSQAALRHAGSDIFRQNVPILPIVAALDSAGFRLGILSNTCVAHWEYCQRYKILTHAFSVYALSFRIGALKPDPKIYAAAAELAEVKPQEILFIDDIAGHVAGAKAAGFAAVQYVNVPRLAADLRGLGLRFDY